MVGHEVLFETKLTLACASVISAVEMIGGWDTLTIMNQEQQIKALAELDGWKEHVVTIQSEHDYKECRWHSTVDERDDIRRLPNYLTSYDAIIPLMQKQPRDVRKAMTQTFPNGHVSFTTTPAQLCEALLRATGKWIE